MTQSYFPVRNWWDDIKLGYEPGRLLGRKSGFLPVNCPGSSVPVLSSTLTRLTFRAVDGTELELQDEATNGAPGGADIAHSVMSAIPQTMELRRRARSQVIRVAEWSGFFFWLLPETAAILSIRSGAANPGGRWSGDCHSSSTATPGIDRYSVEDSGVRRARDAGDVA
jgi:hypothetical protein